jgi:hypothetical protein
MLAREFMVDDVRACSPCRALRARSARGSLLMNAYCSGRIWIATAMILVVSACSGSPTAVTPDPAIARASAGTASTTPPARPAITPAEYVRLHNIASDPRDSGWGAAVRELAVVGDAYTLTQLRSVARSALTPADEATLDATIAALAAGPGAASGPPSAAEIQTRLERAAWADLLCDRCESTLVPWATKSISDFATDPHVRATLEHLRDGYEPSAGIEPPSQWGHLSERVRGYARKILQGNGEQKATKSP